MTSLNKSENEFLIKECNENMNLDINISELNKIFNQESPYKFPQLIICNDVKRNNTDSNIYQKYSDVIYDECGNRFNMKNLKDSAGLLQEGYSRNIDVDSHLKNINYYADRCYYNNWKLSPDDQMLDKCNGLKHNAAILSPNYQSVGGNDINSKPKGICNTSPEYTNTIATKPTPTNTSTSNPSPTESSDINCDSNIKKRYNFSNHNLQKESCIKPADWTYFKHAPTPNINNISKFPSEKKNLELLNSINKGVKHDYYTFFDNNQCQIFPQQRLFNNITKRSMLPTHHNLEDMGPKYFK